jgi:hypothetical protein
MMIDSYYICYYDRNEEEYNGEDIKASVFQNIRRKESHRKQWQRFDTIHFQFATIGIQRIGTKRT